MKIRFTMFIIIGILAWWSIPQAQDTRQFWISPVEGSGTDADPYHSRCLGMAGAGNIDLRPEIDGFLCASNTLPANMTGVEQLGASYKSALGSKKSSLEAKFKKSVSATTVEDLVIELISPILQAGKDGKLKIYLGEKVPIYQQTAGIPFRDNGLVADVRNYAAEMLEPAIAWATTLAIDNFPTTGDLNGSTQVHPWTEFNGTILAVSSNSVTASAANTGEARADVDLATDTMEVQVKVTGTADASGEVRVGVLAKKANNSTRTYVAGNAVFSSAAEWRVSTRVTGSSTTLATNLTDPVSGDVVKLRSDGSSHSLYVNGVEFITPQTDGTGSGNTRAGLFYIGAHANDVGSLTNWVAWDYPNTRIRGGGTWLP